jgi:hypothetical protein
MAQCFKTKLIVVEFSGNVSATTIPLRLDGCIRVHSAILIAQFAFDSGLIEFSDYGT